MDHLDMPPPLELADRPTGLGGLKLPSIGLEDWLPGIQSTGLGDWLPQWAAMDCLDVQPPPGLGYDDVPWTRTCRTAACIKVEAAKNAVDETDMNGIWKAAFAGAMFLLRHAQTSGEAARAYLIAYDIVAASGMAGDRFGGLVQARDATVWLLLAVAGVTSRQQFFEVVRKAFGPRHDINLHSQCMMSAMRVLDMHGIEHRFRHRRLHRGHRGHRRLHFANEQ